MENAEFECAICLDICRNAVESSCCCTLYCEECTQGLSQCPSCRKDFHVVSSRLARKMIGRLKIECQRCHLSVQRNSVNEHLKLCEMRDLVCAARGCGFMGAKKEFLEHVNCVHEEDILSVTQGLRKMHVFKPFSADFAMQTVIKTNGATQASSCVCQQSSNSMMKSHEHKPIKKGKYYYCGRRLPTLCPCGIIFHDDMIRYGCEDGICGPGQGHMILPGGNGHNCADCQRMDLQERGWPLQGCVVDTETSEMINLRAAFDQCMISRLPATGCTGDCKTCILFKLLSVDSKSVYHQFR